MTLQQVVPDAPFVNGKCPIGAETSTLAANATQAPQGKRGKPRAPSGRGKLHPNGKPARARRHGHDDAKTHEAGTTANHEVRPFADHASRLLDLGYSPLPVEPRQKRPAAVLHGGSAEWQPWSDYCETPLSGDEIGVLASNAPYGLGLACGYGGLVAIDIDTDDMETVAAIEAGLPALMIGKRGAKGATWLFRDPTGKIAARAFKGADGGSLVDVLASGRQTVIPPTMHPDTGATYAWLTDRTLFDTPLAEIPVITPDHIVALETALAPWRAKPKPVKDGAAVRPKGARFAHGERKRYEAYAQAALDSESGKVCGATAGRNAAVFNAACALGKHVHHGLLSERGVTDALMAACEANGYAAKDGKRDCIATIASGLHVARDDGLPELKERPRAKIARGENGAAAGHPYLDTPGGLVWRKPSRAEGESIDISLTNFSACIVRDVIEDDGAETSRVFEIEARLDGRTQTFGVPGAAFSGLAWVTEKIGAAAFISPGMGTKDHARAAIQKLSGRISERRVYTHTGWREIDGAHVYLHGRGAIGADGAVANIGVSLAGVLAGYELPDPPRGEALRTAIQASLRILDIAPDRVTVPLLATVCRAPLGVSDFTTHLAGKTGGFKSELAGLAMQHWGASWNGKGLPANFESSAAFCQSLQFQAKDALFVVDDFIPPSGQHEAAKYDTNAGKLIRGAGNIAGRGRADTTGKARAAKPPRGQTLTTGEDIPTGHSCRARLFVVEWTKGEVDIAKLTAAQTVGQAGVYAAAMAGYVQWLAADYPARKAAFDAEMKRRRDVMHALYPHGRTATTAAALLAAWDMFLRFAEGAGAIDASSASMLAARADRAIHEGARLQSDHQTAADPVDNFRRLLASSVASGRAHLASETGGPPDDASAWGWRREGVAWEPRGDRIGWVKDGHVYLEPTAAHAAAQAMGRSTNEAFSLTPATLQKRLFERGLILSTEEEKGKKRLTIKKVLGGVRQRVLHFLWLLLPLEGGASGAVEDNG